MKKEKTFLIIKTSIKSCDLIDCTNAVSSYLLLGIRFLSLIETRQNIFFDSPVNFAFFSNQYCFFSFPFGIDESKISDERIHTLCALELCAIRQMPEEE